MTIKILRLVLLLSYFKIQHKSNKFKIQHKVTFKKNPVLEKFVNAKKLFSASTNAFLFSKLKKRNTWSETFIFEDFVDNISHYYLFMLCFLKYILFKFIFIRNIYLKLFIFTYIENTLELIFYLLLLKIFYFFKLLFIL